MKICVTQTKCCNMLDILKDLNATKDSDFWMRILTELEFCLRLSIRLFVLLMDYLTFNIVLELGNVVMSGFALNTTRNIRGHGQVFTLLSLNFHKTFAYFCCFITCPSYGLIRCCNRPRPSSVVQGLCQMWSITPLLQVAILAFVKYPFSPLIVYLTSR